MLTLLSERLVIRLARDAFGRDAERERRAILDEAIRTAVAPWRAFLERHAHRIERGGVPTLLALAEAEPPSSEIHAAARAHLAMHPVARPSLVARTRSVRDACLRTLEPSPRVVLECAHLPIGESVAYAGGWGALHRFDLVTGEVRSGEPTDANPRALVVAPGHGPIVTASDDGTIHVWDRETLATRQSRKAHGDVVGLALSPDGSQLAIATDSGLQIGVPGGRGLRTMIRDACTSAPAFDASGRSIAVVTIDGTVRITDISGGGASRTLAATNRIEAVAFHPDGRLLASSEEGLEIWDVTTGRRVAALTTPRHGARAVSGVDHIALGADGRTAITGGASDDLVLWDLQRHVARGVLVTGALDAIGMFLLPDGRIATFEHDAARLWNVASFTTETPPRRSVGGITFVDNARLLTANASEVRLHDTTTLASIAHVQGPALRRLDGVNLAVSPDGSYVALWAGDDLVVRDTGSLAETWRFTTRPDDEEYDEDTYEDQSIDAVAFVGSHLAVASAHERFVAVVAPDGTPVTTLAGHRAPPDEIAGVAAGTIVTRASGDVIAWRLDGTKATVAHRRAVNAATDGIVATALSPDATRFAVEGGAAFVITDLATGTVTRRRNELSLQGTALAFTPDGRTIVGLVSGDLVVRDASTGDIKASASGLDARAMRLLPDGEHVLLWADDLLSIHDLATATELARWVATAPIQNLAVSPSGALVAIATTVGNLELVRWHDGPPALVARVDLPLEPEPAEPEPDDDLADMFAADMKGLPPTGVERVHALLDRAEDALPLQEEEYLAAALAHVDELRGTMPADRYAELQREVGVALVQSGDDQLAKKGVALLRQAVEAGSPDAMFSLGLELLNGDYVKARPKEAAALLARAAQRYAEIADADHEAAASLAIFYKEGLGVAKDAKLAKHWYEHAKTVGHDWSDDDRW